MLSGEFGSISLDEIHDRPNGDQRRAVVPADIEAIAASIAKRGLIHPIVLTREHVLVAGKTRLLAHRHLGLTHITYQYEDTLDEIEHKEIELEENVKRKDLPWQDNCDAVLQLHELYRARDAAWTAKQTAKELGFSEVTVGQYIAVAQKLKEGDVRVSAAKEFSVARGITSRINQRKAADQISLLTLDDSPAAPEVTKDSAPILNVDFLTWVEGYKGQPFNLIHCDFPYGIGADKFDQGSGDAFGSYEDTPETYWQLVQGLCNNKDKLLGSSGHVIFWFSMRYYTETLAALKEHFWVDPYPLVWHKSDNKGTLPDPERGPRRVYEVAYLCSYGDRKILSAVANTFSGPTQRTAEHMSEKSQDMLQHFFRMCVDEGTRMLDPTCGSGSALRAADRLGAGSVLGLEMNKDFAANAARAWDTRNV